MAVRRPAWYAIGLGICTGLALGGFAVPGMATAGFALGGIIVPVLLDLEVRRRTGGSPVRAYLEPPTRGTALAAVVIGAVIAAAGLVALKVSGQSWVVLPGALVVGIGTAVVARRIDRLRVEHHRMRPRRA